MKNRVKIIYRKYTVSNGTVICELKCDLQFIKAKAYWGLNDYIWKKKVKDVDYEGIFKVKGVAKCSPSDTFNEELGKRIAESRAKKKMFRTASRVWELCYKEISKQAAECRRLCSACCTEELIEEEHVRELCK